VPLPDSNPPPEGNGAYGWIAAGAVLILGAVGTFWRTVRGGRSEDRAKLVTDQNRIIKGHEQYATLLENRLSESREREATLETENRQLKSDLTAALIEKERLEARNADLELRIAPEGD
jgi:uncharacterized protein HemX